MTNGNIDLQSRWNAPRLSPGPLVNLTNSKKLLVALVSLTLNGCLLVQDVTNADRCYSPTVKVDLVDPKEENVTIQIQK